MKKEYLRIAFAYVGVIVGAGLSSGQDILQYFLSFGLKGIIGILVLTLISIFFGSVIITLGSYYNSDNHDDVLREISHPILTRFIDISLFVSNFIVGFVMLAGAGANAQQQFGIPVWIGALVCAILTIGVAFLDFEKITNILGIFTPILLVMIVIVSIYSFVTVDIDIERLNQVATTIKSPMPNIYFSVINYFALCAMTGVSMAFVLGGSVLKIGTSQKAGRVGGALVGFIIFIVAVTMFLNLDIAKDADIPMLMVVNQINPVFSFLYTLTIFALIFNTCFSLFYAIARRFGGDDLKKVRMILIAVVIVGYFLSFSGFKTLVSIMYPILGYIGMVLLVVLTVAYFREKEGFKKEKNIRRNMIKIFSKKYDDDQDYTRKDAAIFHELGEKSQADTDKIKEAVKEHVEEKFADEN